MQIRKTALFALGTCLVLSVLSPVAASAATTAAAGADDQKVLVASGTAPMTFGIDEAAAKAAGQTVVVEHGQQVLYDKSGQVIIRIPTEGSTGITPMGTVYGNCGQSYYDLYKTSGKKYKLDTGFALTGGRTAWLAEWDTVASETKGGDVIAHFNTSEKESLLSAYYNHTYSGSVEYTGMKVTGRVEFGRAWIAGGLFCDSGHPTDSISIP